MKTARKHLTLLLTCTLLILLTLQVRAAKTQYIELANNLISFSHDGNSGVTATDVTVALYNGGATPCFSTVLPFGSVIALSTGLRSPCVAAIQEVSVISRSTYYGDIFAPLDRVSLGSELQSLKLTISSSVAPVFDQESGVVLKPGTAQFTSTSL